MGRSQSSLARNRCSAGSFVPITPHECLHFLRTNGLDTRMEQSHFLSLLARGNFGALRGREQESCDRFLVVGDCSSCYRTRLERIGGVVFLFLLFRKFRILTSEAILVSEGGLRRRTSGKLCQSS
jgi:hypothetical protein